MSGIAGCIGARAGGGDAELVLRMLDAQRHRGARSVRTAAAAEAVFGRCTRERPGRASANPYRTRDGRILLALDGEIHNEGPLRARLARRLKGVELPAGAAAILAEWFTLIGTALVPELDGSFALAAYDTAARCATLVRDRVGSKPLYYVRAAGGAAFASELTPLRRSPVCPAALDAAALAQYMALGAVPAPAALIESVRKVEPGSIVSIDERGVSSETYWTPILSAPRSRSGSREMLLALEGAVECRLPADGPVGVFLSGGLDSGLVAALARRRSSAPVQSFAIGFPDEPRCDDTRMAEAVACHLDTRHQTLRVSRRELAEASLRTLPSIDEPIADDSLVPTAMLAEAARATVTTVLTGDGADELLMGDEVFLSTEPESRRAVAEPAGPQGTDVHPAERLQIRRLSREFRDVTLARLDRATGTHAVDARCPFLDIGVMAVALGLPLTAKVDGASTKKVLRECAAGLLPVAAVNRRRRGFATPTADLLRRELRSYAQDVLASAALRSAGPWKREQIDALVADHLAGRRDQHRPLWSLVCLAAWLLRTA